MIRNPWRFLLVGLFAAWAVDFLFWEKPLGISYLIWSLLLVGGGVLLARCEKVTIHRRSFILMAAVFFLSLLVFIREEPFTQLVSVFFSILLVLVLAATFLSGHWFYYRVVDYLVAGWQAFISAFARPFDLSKPNEDTPNGDGFHWKKILKRLLPVLRGLLLAAPVVVVLAALLSAADPIFSDQLQNWFKFFNIERLPEYLFRFFYILALGYLFTGLYLFAVRPRRMQEKPDPDAPILQGFLGWVETAVVLISVNLLFAIFLVIQFRYFFGGEANIHAAGYTYAEYARRGFGELLIVALLSLLLYLALGTVARLRGERARQGFTILAALLILQVMVILTSSFQRLLLYENAYGFTRLRMYSHVFMIWLAVLLGAVLILEFFRKRGRFALALLAAAFGFCLTLAAVNVDAMIVRQNVHRAAESELDGDYLKFLSADAVPAMRNAFTAAQDPDVRDILGAELACRQVLLQENPRSWQGFSLSRLRAKHSIAEIDQALTAYPVSEGKDGWMVTLNGEREYCLPSEPLGFD